MRTTIPEILNGSLMSAEVLTADQPKEKSRHLYLRNEELNLNIHTDDSVFSKLETEWAKLAQLSNQMICMSTGWAASWWKHFGRHRKRSLFIITVYDNAKLVAIFPFYKGVTKVGGVTIQKRLQIIGSGGSTNEQFGFLDDYGISDFLDVIVHPEYNDSVADLFAKLLNTPEFSDHYITFHQAREDSYVMQNLYPLLKKLKRRVRSERTDISYYIELDQKGNLKDFIKKSKSNARRRFRQTLRARGIENEYVIEEPETMADVQKMIDKLIQLHQDRWHKIGYPGAFQDERFKAFFKDISFTAYRENRLWIKQAVDDGGVCSVRMLLMHNGRFYDYMSGFYEDSPSEKYRPGIGLLLELVENSFALPIERIELLRGDEGYKQDFTNLALYNWKITIPEVRQRKTGWGIPAAVAQLCSILLKYFNREKTLLRVQYQEVGLTLMFSEYFKFRWNTLKRKIR